jgi:putative transposase
MSQLSSLAGWINRHQQQIITYLHEENRVLKTRLRGRQLRLTDTDCRRLAALARPLGRQRLTEIATIATPDTLLRWNRRLIAQKCDGSRYRQQPGRPHVAEEIEQLVVRMAEENPSWGYHRIQGVLANLRFYIDTSTVRNILRRHHKFGQQYANQLRRRQPRPGDKWHLDEVFLTIRGERHYRRSALSHS